MTVRAQVPVGAPLAPVALATTPTTIQLSLDNPGGVCDPVGVGFVVEVNGVAGAVVPLGEGAPQPAQVYHTLIGLVEGVEHAVRHKVVVGDAALDGAAPWSPLTVVRTPTVVEVRLVSECV